MTLIMKTLKILTLCILLSGTMSSCATVFGGPVSSCQRTRPAAGQPARQIRVIALVADIVIFFPSLIVDFATGAIYAPCGR